VNSYRETLRYLYSLQHRGMKFGLRNTTMLLRALGNPERQFPSIHIAGTNGKGSTASFLASIGTESGYATGLYTSPHLIRFTERIRIDGKEMPEDRLVQYVRMLRPFIEAVHATFFEATTCIAFRYFADENVGLAVVETGMGGRLDSTNVLMPVVSVITSIALDHTAILGRTVKAIAREKGGIIKKGVPCVVGRMDREVIHTLRSLAKERGAHLVQSQRKVSVHENQVEGLTPVIDCLGKTVRIHKCPLGLAGAHQVWNAQTAVSTIDVLNGLPKTRRQIKRVTSTSVARGLARVVKNTGLHGRLETPGNQRRYIMDVAHNPDAIRTLVQTLRRRGLTRLIVVFGVMEDKDYTAMIRELSHVMTLLVPVVPASKRALRLGKLAMSARKAGIRVADGGSVAQGLRNARRLARRGSRILITGSHYVVGEAMAMLAKGPGK